MDKIVVVEYAEFIKSYANCNINSDFIYAVGDEFSERNPFIIAESVMRGRIGEVLHHSGSGWYDVRFKNEDGSWLNTISSAPMMRQPHAYIKKYMAYV